MSKKNFKKTAALMLAATMTVGSVMTAFAADGVGEGTGTYEGTKLEAIPEVSVSLPTESTLQNIYNYVADPNGMIEDTADNGRLGNSVTVNTNAGILFADGTTYAGTSKKIEVESENYQDVDITVELKVKDGAKGDADIVYSDKNTFEATDTEKKLYLAVTDGAATDPKTAALPASGVVKLTQTVKGVPTNFTLKYKTDKYEYEKNSGATGWNKAGFALTGAINKNAEWGEGVTFPTLQVTWSVAAHTDSLLTVSEVSATSNTLTIPTGVTVNKVTLVQSSGNKIVAQAGKHYTFTNGTLSIQTTMLSGNVGGSLEIELAQDGTNKTETVSIK